MTQANSFYIDDFGELVLTVDFNGHTYSKTSGSQYFQRAGGHTLHRDIYEFYSGQQVTCGMVVHHKDGNKLNNSFENLELLTSNEHTSRHRKEDYVNTLKSETPDWLKRNVQAVLKIKKLKPYEVAKRLHKRSTFAMFRDICDINELQNLANEIGCEIADFFKTKQESL